LGTGQTKVRPLIGAIQTYYVSALRSRFIIGLDRTDKATEIKSRQLRALRGLMIEELLYNQ
jgi:hypothetical protein